MQPEIIRNEIKHIDLSQTFHLHRHYNFPELLEWADSTVCFSSSPESLLFLTFSVILRRPQERPVPRFTTPQKEGTEGKKRTHSSLADVFPLSITTETIRVPINLPPF